MDFQDNNWKYENSYRIVATKPNTALLKKCNEMTEHIDFCMVEVYNNVKRKVFSWGRRIGYEKTNCYFGKRVEC